MSWGFQQRQFRTLLALITARQLWCDLKLIQYSKSKLLTCFINGTKLYCVALGVFHCDLVNKLTIHAHHDCTLIRALKKVLIVFAAMKLQRLSVAPVLLTLCVATLLILSCAGVADGANFPPPHCRSEAAESLPPRLRRICAALYGIAEISQAVEQYLDDKSMSFTSSHFQLISYFMFHSIKVYSSYYYLLLFIFIIIIIIHYYYLLLHIIIYYHLLLLLLLLLLLSSKWLINFESFVLITRIRLNLNLIC